MSAKIIGTIRKTKAKKTTSAKVVDNSAVKKQYVVTSTLYSTRRLAEKHLREVSEISQKKKKLMVVEVAKIIVTRNTKAKEYFMVNSKGHVVSAPCTGLYAAQRMGFGNAFTTREQAEEAKKRIQKLLRRIKK